MASIENWLTVLRKAEDAKVWEEEKRLSNPDLHFVEIFIGFSLLPLK